VGCRQQKLIDTVIDTGFNGFISLPSSIITALVLDDLILADAEIQAAIQNQGSVSKSWEIVNTD
jgi:predicted aspartyl protease